MQRSLENILQEIITQIDGTVGVYATDLEKGLICALNDKEQFSLASTYKIPIAIQCLRKIDQGLLSLDKRIEIGPEDIVESSSILDHRHFSYPGIELSVRNLFRLMLEYSDNTASDIILRMAGGPHGVQQFLKESGFSNISVSRSTVQIFFDHSQNKENTAFLCDERDSGTPGEMAQLIEGVLQNNLLTKPSAEFLVDCMKRCKTGTARIRALLPSEVIVADKTGTATGFVHDIAIIESPRNLGKIILAIYIKDTTAPVQKCESTIANISKAIYDHVFGDSSS